MGDDERRLRITFRERMLRTFERKKIDRILWQPRLEHWYGVNKIHGTLPERYRDMELLKLYDDLGASVRTYGMFNRTIKITEGQDVEVKSEDHDTYVSTTWRTPVGSLSQITQRVRTETEVSAYTVEHMVKTVEDLKILEYILRARKVEFDWEAYESANQLLGDRAEPTIYLPRESLQGLIINYMGFERTIYALHDHPVEVERFLEVMEETDDPVYQVVAESPIRIINFGDNLHAETMPPPLFRKYILPYYQKRSAQLHKAGKFTHAHWDGYVKTLLPFAKETGLDGLEALTPLPQGDVTLEEIKEALGDELILIDGIPATHFLEQTSYKELKEFTLKVLDMFSPNLILGISDEISPIGDIEKVRLVSEIVAEYNP
jgi:hypothetical protein